MSTRCQIGLYENNESNFTTLLYKHSDGYPEHTIPLLLEFLKEFPIAGYFDVSYCGAWLIHHMIAKDVAKYGKDYSGYGICGDKEIHDDIEYFYAIYPDRVEVYKTRGYSPSNWPLIETHPIPTK